MSEASNTEDFALTLFEQARERYIQPEIAARLERGGISLGDPVVAFLVAFGAAGSWQVFLNGEVPGDFMIVAARDLAKDEEVGVADFKDLSKFVPHDQLDNVQYIVGLQVQDGWRLTFDFSQIHLDAEPHLLAGQQFLATSKEALAAGRLNVFADNAYSAVELFARAELLCAVPTAPRIEVAKTHGQVRSTYNAWSHLENTDSRFSRVMNLLDRERGSARYLRGEMSLDPAKCQEIVETLDEMSLAVRKLIDKENDGPGTMYLYAKRPIKAGEIVSTDDMSIVPPKPDDGDES